MLQKNGDFIFRASVISNSCAWQNVAEIGHFTTDARLIRRAGFRGMGVGILMPAHQGKFVAYFRVSTDKQGKSGLGLEGQREAVNAYLNGGRWSLLQEFVEVESGKRNDRPQLAAALVACKKHKAKLIIAKLDRLSRNLAFIATLMDSSVPALRPAWPK
jgi:hypothetical protein